ncbi:hypothetical protein ACSFA0_20610 [Variovorax sp. LT1P1]|uniref:hypothetical protein n=1 Tax=Variovorax sp. LT1P1 TaxID=3443730 RepID=UPI003F48AD48
MSDPKMPNDDWDEDLGGADDGALHDPLLQQVLDHAPDHALAPDAALRQSIRVLAHEAVAPSLPAGPVGAERPWWQRLLGIGGGAGSHRPWNAAFAKVLVGVLITVMWQREPVPDAQLDAPQAERQAAPAAPVVAPAAQPAEAPPSPPPLPSVLDTTLAESRAVTEAANRALDERDRERERLARQAAADREATLAADKAVERAQQALAREEAAKMKAEPPLPPPVQWPPPMPAPAAPAANASPPGAAQRTAPPVASAAPSRAAGIASPPPVPPAAAAPAPSVTAQPTFDALAQWTQLRIARNGADSRVLPRAEARELGGLVGSAALAGVGTQPLAGAVDWRITLERNGEVLGVLELAGGQVRWREKGLPPGTGQPGAGALSSLRQALEEVR